MKNNRQLVFSSDCLQSNQSDNPAKIKGGEEGGGDVGWALLHVGSDPSGKS